MRRDLALAATAFAVVLAALGAHAFDPPVPGEPLRFEWILAGAKRSVEMRPRAAGGFEYRLPDGPDSDEGWLGAERFQALVAEAARTHSGRHAMLKLVNASSWSSFGWVLLGLGGQLCFFGRMFVQWLASERAGASVVPPVFWGLSLVGGLALLAYFVWRRDPIGILGQATGAFVYSRNLWLVRASRGRPDPRATPG